MSLGSKGIQVVFAYAALSETISTQYEHAIAECEG
jgi:hypothetical protein